MAPSEAALEWALIEELAGAPYAGHSEEIRHFRGTMFADIHYFSIEHRRDLSWSIASSMLYRRGDFASIIETLRGRRFRKKHGLPSLENTPDGVDEGNPPD